MIDILMAQALKRFLESSACKNDCDPEDMTCDTNFARMVLSRFCEEKALQISELNAEKDRLEALVLSKESEREEIITFLEWITCKKCRGFTIGGQGRRRKRKKNRVRICSCR